MASSAPALAQEETVIVTAERRPQPIEEEGSSVAVLSHEDLQRVGAQHPVEALNRLPGVNFHRGSGVESLPAVRSPVLNGGQGAGSFLVLEDGVPVRAAAFANINQLYETNIELADQVEIIRGPGTVVHGANAVHGVINVITPSAGADSYLEAEAGSFGRQRASVFLQGDRLIAGLAARHENGWRQDAGLDLQKLLVGWDGDAGAWRVRARLAAVNLEQETAGFAIGPDAYDNGALARDNLNPEAFRDSRVLRASLAASRSFGAVDLALTPFARTIETDLLLHFFPSKALEETAQSGGGVQSTLAWSIAPNWRAIAGVDLDSSTATLRETQSLPTVGTFPQGMHYDYTVDVFSSAAYAQLNWRASPDWSLTLGARGESAEYVYDNHAPDGGFGRFLRVPDREDEFSALTARFNVVRRLFEDGALYFNLTAGARPPQASDLYSLQITQAPGEQGVEDIRSAEIGLRAPIGAGALSLVIYDMSKRHGAFRNANGFTIDNIRTRHQGVEASIDAPLGDAFELSGWVSYADHTYDFTDAPDGIFPGGRIESAPEWMAAGQLTWRPTERLEAELGWSHIGEYATESSGAHDYPGHDVFSLRGLWRVNDHTELFGAIRNLTNTDYAERADFAFGNERYFPGEDRAFSLGVRVRR
jgi:outer membrane receptor protein involved in Fe transport